MNRFWDLFSSNLKLFIRDSVLIAEERLKSKSGQERLLFVYNQAIEKYPWVGKFMPFSVFSAYVDEALKSVSNLISEIDNNGMTAHQAISLMNEIDKK